MLNSADAGQNPFTEWVLSAEADRRCRRQFKLKLLTCYWTRQRH